MSVHQNIDIQENYIQCLNAELLSILLKDRSSGKNIVWATDIYANKGSSYDAWEPITVKLITGRFGKVIRPRIDKSKKEQKIRIKDKAEVFTPSWICNEMNNHLCEEWFGSKDVFNTAKEKTWIVNNNKIPFTNEENKTWQDFVRLKVLEISCGEAPFLASRYDTTTGEWIDIGSRIGALDRKLRVINENCETEQDWYAWTLVAFKSTFGYEWQGDSLLIARENLLFTFIDYYIAKFGIFPIKEYLIEISKILSWNIWQMDGLKNVIPNSCKPTQNRQISLFDEEIEPCKGCDKNDNNNHIGIYCKIMNWKTKRSIKFFKGEKRMKFDFVIGNPPYSIDVVGENGNWALPVYDKFFEASRKISKKIELITPARFLFNAGSTSKVWNNFMLNDKHFKVLKYFANSKDVFQGVTISGGVVISYIDKDIDYIPIKVFTDKPTLNDILHKVIKNGGRSITEIIYTQNKFDIENIKKDFSNINNVLGSDGTDRRFETNIFAKSNLFRDQKMSGDLSVLGVLDNKRCWKYINQKYVDMQHKNINKHKVLVVRVNAIGFGEVLTNPVVAKPFEGYTKTFIGFGAEDNQKNALHILKYIKSKFTRTMLGVLKATQQNNKATWAMVPLQDFTEKSDIDWSKSIHEIDLQLYKKYGLTQKEIDFIESHVKEMK